MTYPDATQGTTSFNAVEAQSIVCSSISGSQSYIVTEVETIMTGTSGTYGNMQATNLILTKHIGITGTATGTQADLTTANVKNLNGSTVTGSIATLKDIVGSQMSGSIATLKQMDGSIVTGSSVTTPLVTGSTITGSEISLSTSVVTPLLTGSTITGSQATLKDIVGSQMSGSIATLKDVVGSQISGSIATLKDIAGSQISGSVITVPLVTGSTITGSEIDIKNITGSNISGSKMTMPAGMPGLIEIKTGTTEAANATMGFAHSLGVAPSYIGLTAVGTSISGPFVVEISTTGTVAISNTVGTVAFMAMLVK